MIKYFKINWVLLRNAYIRDSKIGGFILVNIISQFFDVSVSIIFFSVLFSNTQEIGGWQYYQILFLYGYIRTIASIHGMLTKKGITSMASELIRLGDLDFYLTKPADPMIMVAISKPRIYTFLVILYEIGIMIFAAIKGHFHLGLTNLLAFLFLTFCVLILYLFLSILTVIPAFWTTRLWTLAELMGRLTNFARYPASVFPKFFRIAFFTAFPILAISYLPVKTLLFDPNPLYILYITAITIVFGFITRWFWNLGIRNYGSASS